jgi:methyltransferase (TIGR00027 family)
MQVEMISDTARWIAYMRAVESERPDALFRDIYSRRLAGAAGEAIAHDLGSIEMISSSIAVRTAVLDRLILEMVTRDEVDLVLNIGTGFDTRPWRLGLPAKLQWLDVDLPRILDHKAEVLRGRSTTCQYEALPADIVDASQRAAVLSAFPATRRVLVVTEGLLVYLKPTQVRELAEDLWNRPSCRWWLTDLVGPRALQLLRQVWSVKLRSDAFHFGPADSVRFFGKLGWQEQSFHSSQEEARRLNRTPRNAWLVRLLSMLSTPSTREELRRLSGVAVMARDPDLQSAGRAESR